MASPISLFLLLLCLIFSSKLACAQTQSIYLTNCDWCASHFSSCHQPTSAPDSVIFTQCYCDTSFQAVYSTCLTSCGWESAGIPPLSVITSSCNGFVNNATPQTATSPTPTGNTPARSTTPAASSVATEGSNPPATFSTTPSTSSQGTKITSSGGGSGSTKSASSNGNAMTASSGIGDRWEDRGLLFRLEAALIAGLVVVWIFGWL